MAVEHVSNVPVDREGTRKKLSKYMYILINLSVLVHC